MAESSEKNSPTPESLFAQAADFLFPSQLLWDHTVQVLPQLIKAAEGKATLRPPAFIPSIVLSAFSLELLLKCIGLISTGKYAPIHDLYKSLPGNIQSDINAVYLKAKNEPRNASSVPGLASDGTPYPPDYYDINAVLERIGPAFVKWRYSFEGEFRAEYSGVAPLAEALIATIISLRCSVETFLTGSGQEHEVVGQHAE
jgi:hypothetical protein